MKRIQGEERNADDQHCDCNLQKSQLAFDRFIHCHPLFVSYDHPTSVFDHRRRCF